MLTTSKTAFPKSLETDDIDLCFSPSSHFLSLFHPEPPHQLLDLKSHFLLSFLSKNDSNGPLLLKNRLKSYSFDSLDFIDLQDPLKFKSLVFQERKKLIIELVFFLENDFSNCPPKILNVLSEIIAKILISNPFELISNKIRESFLMIESMISELLKDFKNLNNDGFFSSNSNNSCESSQNLPSPLSILTGPVSPIDPLIDDFSQNNKKFIIIPETTKKTQTPLKKKHLISSLKTLKKLKFLLSKLGHFIHWKGFLKVSPQKLKTFAIFKPQQKSHDFFNNRSLFYIKELFKAQELSSFIYQNPNSVDPKALLKYFAWKLSSWKQEKPFSDNNLQNKNLMTHEMICKICLKPIEIQKMTLHSEDCMKRSELLRQLESLKSYFQEYFLKSYQNARYNEKLYGIETKKQKNGEISHSLERKNSMKSSGYVKNLKKPLKLKVFKDEKDQEIPSPDPISEKISVFRLESPFNMNNQAQSQEKLKKIYRIIKLFDLIAKTSSFFFHENLNKSKFL